MVLEIKKLSITVIDTAHGQTDVSGLICRYNLTTKRLILASNGRFRGIKWKTV